MKIRKALIAATLTIALTGAAAVAGLGYLGYFSDDPFTVMLATRQSDRPKAKIVFLSGDMGFNVGMGPRISRSLNAAGYPVLGFNSLSWFRRTRSPEEVAALIPALLDRSDAAFGPGPTILVGQSFGADVLILGLARLPETDRKRITAAALIVPTTNLSLRASPGEIFDFASDKIEALPTARKLTWLPLLCINGREERSTLCAQLHAGNVTSVRLPGGHYLDGDADAVGRALVTFCEERGSSL